MAATDMELDNDSVVAQDTAPGDRDGEDARAVRKFMFDTAIFDVQLDPLDTTADDEATADPEEPPPPPPPPGITLDELRRAREEAYAEGMAAGRDSTVARQQEHTAQALIHVAKVADYLLALDHQERQQAGRQILDGAMAIARRLFPVMAEQGRIDDIARMAQETLLAHADERELLVAVPTGASSAIEDELKTVLTSRGLVDRVKYVEDPALGPADCRISWADGGATRLIDRVWDSVQQAADQVLAGQAAPTAMSTQAAAEGGTAPTPPGPAPDAFAPDIAETEPPAPDYSQPPEWLASLIAEEPSHVIRELGSLPVETSPEEPEDAG